MENCMIDPPEDWYDGGKEEEEEEESAPARTGTLALFTSVDCGAHSRIEENEMLTARLTVLAALAATLFGQTGRVAMDQQPRVYIAPMVGDLDGFIAAEIIKQHLPMRVVTDERDAQFVLVGLSIKGDDRWYHFAGAKDRNEGNVRLLDLGSKTMVWAGEAGDRSLMFAGWRRGGERKLAQRIAGRMKKEYCENQNLPTAGAKVKGFLFSDGRPVR